MPDMYKQTAAVYRKLGKEYVDQIEPFVVKGMKVFLKKLPRGGRVLDVGCAGGRDSKIFSDQGFEVIGIDVVESFLKIARKKVPKARFIKMDVRRLKFPKEYFDVIWANAVLVHVYEKDIPSVLNKFYNILKPGGRINIRMKEGKSWQEISDPLSPYNKRIFIYLTKKELEQKVRRAGFKIAESKLFPDEIGRKEVKWIGIQAVKEKIFYHPQHPPS